jgi:hypothetical protein
MKIFLLSIFFVSSSIGLSFAQTSINSSSSNQKQVEIKRVPADKIDDYMGYQDQILKRLIANEIPINFPKPEAGETREDYKETMIAWLRKNRNMVKEEYQSELK